MIAQLQAPARPAGTLVEPLSWSSPAAALWVASRTGDFAGFVEFRNGHFEVTDGLGGRLPSCATLQDARASLTTPRPPAPAERSASPVRSAVAVGLVGAGLSILTLTLGLLHL